VLLLHDNDVGASSSLSFSSSFASPFAESQSNHTPSLAQQKLPLAAASDLAALPDFSISLRLSLLSFCCWILCSLLLNNEAIAATGWRTEGVCGDPGMLMGADSGILTGGTFDPLPPSPRPFNASTQSCITKLNQRKKDNTLTTARIECGVKVANQT
jgi:hypothetical protein